MAHARRFHRRDLVRELTAQARKWRINVTERFCTPPQRLGCARSTRANSDNEFSCSPVMPLSNRCPIVSAPSSDPLLERSPSPFIRAQDTSLRKSTTGLRDSESGSFVSILSFNGSSFPKICSNPLFRPRNSALKDSFGAPLSANRRTRSPFFRACSSASAVSRLPTKGKDAQVPAERIWQLKE